jgi:predicted nucleic acid-binding Zn ribbon protein
MDSEKKPLSSLKEILGTLFREGGLPFNPEDARIWKVWKEVVGPVVAARTRPSWIREGRLRVTVSDPIWLQELQFVESEIVEKLNRTLAREAVTRIEFRLGVR